jgi:hypothetical protein
MSNTYTLTINQGETLSLIATWKDSTGTPVNLNGYTASMTLRSTFAAAGTVLFLSTTNSGIALGGTAGTITITAAATATAALTAPQSGVYDLELTSGGAVVTRLLEGAFEVTPEVTR